MAMLALGSCATVEAPKGGPVDKEPPRILAVSPAPRTLNLSTDLDIRLQFSEWIQNPVNRAAIRISPPLDGRIVSDVDGDLLALSSKTKLDTLTTYTISIGSALQDLHGNALAHPYQLVFATGPKVDTLNVHGRVLVPDSLLRKKAFPSVGLFPIGEEFRSKRNYLKKYRDSTLTGPDSAPRLASEPALYVGQTDSLGRFRIDGMAAGRYRTVAFSDVNGNNRIEPMTEVAGLGEFDLTLDTAFKDSLSFTLGDQDTSSLRLTNANVPGPQLASLEFSRPLAKVDPSTSGCGIWNMDSTLLKRPQATWIAPDTKRLWLAFDTVAVNTNYLIGCDSVRDSLGRALNPHINRIRLSWVPAKDSLQQRLLSFRVLGPSPAIDSQPSLEVSYFLPIDMDSLPQTLRLLDSKDTLPVQIKQLDAVRLQVSPSKPLPMGVSYRLVSMRHDTAKVKVDSTLPQAKQDSLRQAAIKPVLQQLGSFETVSPLKLTKLQGRLRGADTTWSVRLRAPKTTYDWLTRCNVNGIFLFASIPEGPYLLDAFADLDGNGRPSPGSIVPLRFAEPWRSLPDTLHVGNDLEPIKLDSLLSRIPIPQRTTR